MTVEEFLELSVSQLEQVTGTAMSTWSRYFAGSFLPNVKFIYFLADTLDMTPVQAFEAFHRYRERYSKVIEDKRRRRDLLKLRRELIQEIDKRLEITDLQEFEEEGLTRL